jgi:hypothetical protein
MLRLLLAALFVLFQLQTGSANPIPNQCLDEKSLRDVLSAQLPDAELASLVGIDAVTFIAGFNTIPPVSQISADAVLIIGIHKGAQVALAFFKNGCMISRGLMPRAQADGLLLQLERSGA